MEQIHKNNLKNEIYIIGAGGHASVVYDTAVSAGYSVVAFLDDKSAGSEIFDVPVIPLPSFSTLSGSSFAIGVGHNRDRQKYFNLLKSDGCLMPPLIHKSAVISPSATIADGTVVMAGVCVNARAAVGHGVILNTGCIVEHDCVIGDFAHISPGAALAGGVHIGEATQAGIGSCVIQYKSVGADCIIAAGAAVTHDFGDRLLIAGVPAVIKKEI